MGYLRVVVVGGRRAGSEVVGVVRLRGPLALLGRGGRRRRRAAAPGLARAGRARRAAAPAGARAARRAVDHLHSGESASRSTRIARCEA